tara:strand:+ start:15724 stop:16047 length:324 start_codon:yes stop_codon:yes gene_type:complete
LYYVITSKKWKRLVATRSFDEAYDFIMKNKDAKIRRMDYTARPKIMDKRLFIKEMYEDSQKTPEDKQRVFKMTDRLIKGKNNHRDFLVLMGLREEYLLWKEITDKIL